MFETGEVGSAVIYQLLKFNKNNEGILCSSFVIIKKETNMRKLFVVILTVLFIGGFTGLAFADCTVTLGWTNATDSDLAGTEIYMHQEGQDYDYGAPVFITVGLEEVAVIEGLDYFTTYYFVARHFDTEDLFSIDSNEVSTTTDQDPVIGVGPGAPTGLGVIEVTCN